MRSFGIPISSKNRDGGEPGTRISFGSLQRSKRLDSLIVTCSNSLRDCGQSLVCGTKETTD